MNSDAYDDPKVEAAWLAEQRAHADEYLRTQRVPFGSVADRPAWHLAPYVALWPVLGQLTSEMQYWVIVGDLPRTSSLPTQLPSLGGPWPASPNGGGDWRMECWRERNIGHLRLVSP